MDFNEYQKKAMSFSIPVIKKNKAYSAIGLCEEAGEEAGKIKKSMRGDGPLDTEAVAKELGDVLWYLSHLTSQLGLSLEQIAKMNIDKLNDRQNRGVINGNGDNR